MEKSTLLALLRTFDRKELRELRKFITSPYFNQRQDVADLFDLLTDAFTNDLPEPDKLAVFQKLYGTDAPFDDHKVRMAMSFLHKLAEQFLVHRAVSADMVAQKTRLAAEYRARRLDKHFQRAAREAEALLENAPLRNAAHHQLCHELELEKYYQTATTAVQRNMELNLQAVTDTLDIAYFSRKLAYACGMIAHQSVYRTEYDFGLLAQILERVEALGLTRHPAIGAYHAAYRAITGTDEAAHFQRLKTYLLDGATAFSEFEMRGLYQLAINFCIRRFNEGVTDYLADQFEIYQEGLRRGLLLENGVLSAYVFRNVVTLGLVMQDFSRVENFIHEFKGKLEPRHREGTTSFSMARLEYERKNYGAALLLLQQSEYRDLLLNLAAKVVMLKIYFETDEFDALDSHLGAIQRFIRRKKEVGYISGHYLGLVHFTRHLMEAAGRDDLAALRQEISETKAVAEKDWLLRMCG